MKVRRFALPALAVALMAVSQTSRAAVLFNISGGAVPAFAYGSATGDNNVINAPGAPLTGSTVFDASGTADWVGSTANSNSVLTVTGLNPGQSFIIGWMFIGSEATDANKFMVSNTGAIVTASSISASGFFADNRNNSCCSSVNAPIINLGATIYTNGAGTTSTPGFTLTDTTSDVTVTNDGSSSNPNPNGGAANLIFAFLTPDNGAHPGVVWDLTSTPTNTIIFAFNDNGSGDDDHDDFVGIATILAGGCDGCLNAPTPLPGSLPLFATGLCALGLLWTSRKRRASR